MPVNEDLLNSTILDLLDKLNQSSLERQTLQNLHINAVSIKLIEVPDPTPEDTERTKKVLPLDPKLDTTITEDRRQAIYDKIISDVAEL